MKENNVQERKKINHIISLEYHMILNTIQGNLRNYTIQLGSNQTDLGKKISFFNMSIHVYRLYILYGSINIPPQKKIFY